VISLATHSLALAAHNMRPDRYSMRVDRPYMPTTSDFLLCLTNTVTRPLPLFSFFSVFAGVHWAYSGFYPLPNWPFVSKSGFQILEQGKRNSFGPGLVGGEEYSKHNISGGGRAGCFFPHGLFHGMETDVLPSRKHGVALLLALDSFGTTAKRLGC
jgi:hypothetical protein